MAQIRQPRHLCLTGLSAGAALAGALCFFSLLWPVLASETWPELIVNPGRYGPYYHIRFGLTAASIDFAKSDRTTSSGGQFELRLHPEYFPVPAPNCRGLLILRMPWTAPDAPDARNKIAAKQALLERILALEGAPEAAIPVVLELNPYVEVTSRTPLQVQLTHCNIFFRHASGGYVDYTGPLRRD